MRRSRFGVRKLAFALEVEITDKGSIAFTKSLGSEDLYFTDIQTLATKSESKLSQSKAPAAQMLE
jgi:hypothetical protein